MSADEVLALKKKKWFCKSSF